MRTSCTPTSGSSRSTSASASAPPYRVATTALMAVYSHRVSAEVAQQGELYCPTCERTFTQGERCPADNTRFVRLTARRDALIGRDLDGRYTIVDKLGQGGMGTVYRGTQHS